MLDQELRLLKERFLQPLVGRIARLGLTPNQLTLISFVLGILAGHFCLEGRLNTALVLWWLNRVVDGVDGAVARHLRRQTDFGGYLDIICDFIVYTTIPIDLAFFQVTSACSNATIDVPSRGCGFKAADGTSWGPLFWLLASLSFLLGTYFINAASLFMLGGILEKRNLGAQTRGEKTTLTMPVGLIEGTETIIFYSLFIALPQHLTALFVLFGSLVAVTILQRLRWAYRHLDN
ncbi:CDPalcohol phosphatidyltransferase [Acanthamoeba castellanii str. Neff]|uniref:CDPalcohol phosphatidyltransferase n=1 Tax=Acanthamoeba castellanii (strain ATCC 30010 / Neff) TaxID=1257118 RepID=L8HDD0_ACACF|nr:CDPalcohol phosphatidyltransferase [Acanthamoeba castellanii str. Neff]ELR22768.1 CDPalcohol phosphatidyltransferase [Acanthamoeba castellanii str. Neff]